MMNKIARKWTAASLLALGLIWSTGGVGRADDDDDKPKIVAAGKSVLQLLDKMDGQDFDKQDNKLEYAMKGAFRPKSKGGVGIGELKNAGHKDSIELLIMDYAKKAPTNMEVMKYNADMVKAAQITKILAYASPHWAPMKDVGKQTKAAWNGFSDDMKKGADAFLDAAKAKDDKAVGVAVKKLNKSCVDCHAIFRTSQ